MPLAVAATTPKSKLKAAPKSIRRKFSSYHPATLILLRHPHPSIFPQGNRPMDRVKSTPEWNTRQHTP